MAGKLEATANLQFFGPSPDDFYTVLNIEQKIRSQYSKAFEQHPMMLPYFVGDESGCYYDGQMSSLLSASALTATATIYTKNAPGDRLVWATTVVFASLWSVDLVAPGDELPRLQMDVKKIDDFVVVWGAAVSEQKKLSDAELLEIKVGGLGVASIEGEIRIYQ